MAINIADELNAATTKGKLGSAKQVFMDDDKTSVQKAFEDRDEHLTKLDDRSTQMEAAIKDISTTGGASTANAVSFDNTKSGMAAVTAQAAIDEIADKDKSQDAEIAKKANTTDVETKITEGLATKVDKEEGKELIETVIANKLSIVEQTGFLFAFKDSEGNFLGGIRDSGSWDIPEGIPDESRTLLNSLQKQIDDIIALRDSTYTITEQEGYLLAITDKKGKFLGGIRKSGQWHIPSGVSDEAQKNIDAIYKAIQNLNTNLDKEVKERSSLISSNYGSYTWAIANNGTIWLAGNADGEVYMPKGIPTEVKTQLDSIKEELTQGLDEASTRITDLESLVKVKETGSVIAAMVDKNGNELMSIDKNGIFTILNKLVSEDGYSVESVDTMTDSLYAIIDSNRNVVLNITKDKKIQSVNGINFGDDINTGISIVDSQNWLFAIVDSNKDVIGGIDKYGAFFANSIKGVCSVKQVENDNWVLAFMDANDNVLFGIKKDGTFFTNSVQIDGVPSQEESMTFLYVITDSNNKVLWGIMKSGAVYQPYGIPEEVQSVIADIKSSITKLSEKIENSKDQEINNKFLDKVMLYGNAGRGYLGNVALQEPGTTDYCIIMMYGQSLSNGSENPAGFNDDVVDRCYMLGSNVWTISGGTLNALSVGGTVRADGVATGTRQDTIVSTVNTFVSLYKKERPWDTNTKFIACSLGVGGWTVAQLSGNKYADGNSSARRYPNCNGKRLEDGVKPFFQSVKAIADAEGKTISLSAVFWKQGESDYGQSYIGKTYDEWKAIQDAKTTVDSNAMGGSKDAYKKGLTLLKEDIFALAKEIFGDDQANRPVFMPYSVCGTYISNAYQTINDATYEMANEQDDVVQVGPTYVTPDYNGGHLAMNGYRWFGEYCAKALYYVFLKHMDFRPLQPESFDVKDNKVYIYIQPIVPPLRIDKYTPGDTYKNLGFSVRMGTVAQLDSWKSMTSGGLQTITDITLSENCVILTCGNIEKFENAVEISYAGQGESGYGGHNQGAGNIRDCDPWQSKYKYREDAYDHGGRSSFSVWSSVRVATDTDKTTYSEWNKTTTYNYGDMCLYTINDVVYVIKSNKDSNTGVTPANGTSWTYASLWLGSTKATEEEIKSLEYWDESYASSTGYVYGDKVLFNIIEVDGPIVLTNNYGDAAGTVVNKNKPFNPVNYHTTDVKGNTIVGKSYPMQNWLLNFYKRIVL